jgi:transcriptional regulator with XRE-family HTH domain
VGRTTLEQLITDRQREARRAIAEELRRCRLERGLSVREVCAGAGIDPAHLSRIESGERTPSQDALVALATAIGCRVSTRLYPTDGPRVRDHVQVRLVEALLRVLHSRWTARLEVAVYRPARGVLDVVLRDGMTNDVVAGEGHSLLASVEHQLRWAGETADSLPSARGWPFSDLQESPTIGRLLLLRSSRAMHELVHAVPATFAAAYPADSRAAFAALTSANARWPGSAIVWAVLDGADSRLIDGTPRGLPPI